MTGIERLLRRLDWRSIAWGVAGAVGVTTIGVSVNVLAGGDWWHVGAGFLALAAFIWEYRNAHRDHDIVHLDAARLGGIPAALRYWADEIGRGETR